MRDGVCLAGDARVTMKFRTEVELIIAYGVVESLILIACLVVVVIQRCIVSPAKPL